MMTDFNSILLLLTILVPLACGAVLLIGGRTVAAAAASIAFLGFLIPALFAFWLWGQYAPAEETGYAFMVDLPTGLEALGIRLMLGLNGISMPLFLMASVVGLSAGLYAIRSKAERLPLFLGLLLVMQGGLMGIFASVDIFFFYFFHELALIPTFLMIGIWGGRDRQYAAIKMTIYLTAGAMLSLFGLIALYVQSGAGTFNLIELKTAMAGQTLSEAASVYTFALLLFGFGILVSLWPFHTWAPLGYGAAPTATAMLHAGVLKKFGLYGLVQVAAPLLPEGAASWAWVLAILALGNILVIGLVTIAQKDLKQMIGYSSVMHMGYCFLGVACLSTVGAGGAVILMFAHGLTVALLFLLSTCIYHRTETFQMEEIGGLAKKTPVLAALFVTAMLASIGLPGPGLANFWGELTVFIGLWLFEPWMVVLAVLGVVISAVYGLRSMANIFFGEMTESFRERAEKKRITDLDASERVPAFILLVVLVAVGLYPRLISDDLNRSLAGLYEDKRPEPFVQESAPEAPKPFVSDLETFSSRKPDGSFPES